MTWFPKHVYAATPAHLQPILAVQATEPLVVHSDALAPEQDMEPSVAEPPANGGQLAQARSHQRIVPPAAVTDRCAIGPPSVADSGRPRGGCCIAGAPAPQTIQGGFTLFGSHPINRLGGI